MSTQLWHRPNKCSSCAKERENGARSDRVVPRNELTRGQNPLGNTHKKHNMWELYPVSILPHFVFIYALYVYFYLFSLTYLKLYSCL